MADDLPGRVERVYAALGDNVEHELANMPPQVAIGEKSFFLFQDFSGGLSSAAMLNRLNQLIHLVGSLEYTAAQWLEHRGHDASALHALYKSSKALGVVHDLMNDEKHPGGRKGNYTGLSLELRDARRVMQIKPRNVKGSVSGLTTGPNGELVGFGDGTQQAVITGEVVDKNGNVIGDANKFLADGLEECEAFLRRYGVRFPWDST